MTEGSPITEGAPREVARTLRRVALWGVLPLVLVLLAAWTWYRVSDTGKRWRYVDRLSGYCAGLLPPQQTEKLTGLRTGTFANELRRGGELKYYQFCSAAGRYITISRVPGAKQGELDPDDIQWYFPYEDVDALPAPVPLGGGWRGHTDVENTVTSLDCGNGGSVVVTAQGEGTEKTMDGDRAPVDRAVVQEVAELVTATAARAADKWGCAAKPPTGPPRIPAMAHVPEPAAGVREGGCVGLPLDRDERIAWSWGGVVGRGSLEERCVLGTREEPYQGQQEGELYTLTAKYGMQAEAARIADHRYSDEWREMRDPFMATARCEGSAVRARFTVAVWDQAADEKKGVALLKEFTRHAAERHGCTDVRMPSGS
ncbi:hypothetical protein [Streptomyces tsukubensis]|uniref:Uncharacterized protein n=1 Tax=Streptomyces tsukubensis TaxID=83656 RepID=A0A1V4AEY1_9ACTN|nr:hypothetical protein [Streptomyces tsukubensis]OON82599.1 hypothetical protein B1H18_00525 [Streptomyces tsukubensis]QFR92236.1 hypothetical protein GBW32_03165 [Streptomyces tsukubensis]